MNSTLPSLMTMLAEIIAEPSISCTTASQDLSNRSVIDKLHIWLTDLGFHCEAIPINGSNHKFNLIATLGKGEGGLVLAGHTDTVPCNEHLWHSNPFTLTEKENKLYGLGTTDMKSFFPLVIEAIKGIREKDLQHPIILLATADEETTMAGARELVRLGRPKARYALIGEPTNMKPVTQHKGMMMEAIRIQGHSGHSSDPRLGANALEAMHQAIGLLIDWRKQLQSQYNNPLFAVPVPTLNLGCIHGGDNPNRICGACELQIDIRPLPGMKLDELRQELKNKLKSVEFDHPGTTLSVEPIYPGLPPFAGDFDNAFIKAAQSLTGHPAESVAFGTEAPYYQQLGIQPLILGPGSITQAHQPNEYLEINTITPMIALIKSLVHQFCLQTTR